MKSLNTAITIIGQKVNMSLSRNYSMTSRILFEAQYHLKKVNNTFGNYVQFKMSRDNANRLRKRAVSTRGNKIVDRRLKKIIRDYCREAFGSTSYWPWIVLYTELRGEFKEGWMPDDYYRFHLLPKMNPERYMRFSEAKTVDHKILNGFIVEPIIVKSNGHFYDKEGKFRTASEARQILNNLDEEVIIKPADGRGGERIIFKNTRELNLEELPHETDYVFQKVVKQHCELNKLYPYSVNTFRVLTFISKDGSINVKFITIRFGRGGVRVDNASRGGGWVFLNLNGTVEPDGYDMEGNFIGRAHPDTGLKYCDLAIPSIDKIKAFCKNAHQHFPYNKIIGWDLFLDEKGDPKLIEWNANNPYLASIEALFGPFFDELIDF